MYGITEDLVRDRQRTLFDEACQSHSPESGSRRRADLRRSRAAATDTRTS